MRSVDLANRVTSCENSLMSPDEDKSLAIAVLCLVISAMIFAAWCDQL